MIARRLYLHAETDAGKRPRITVSRPGNAPIRSVTSRSSWGLFPMRNIRLGSCQGSNHKRAIMRSAKLMAGALLGCAMLFSSAGVDAQDWPQWRGPNRDNKVAGFTAPATWPKELTQKWKVTVGEGLAAPALVGDKVYVFAKQGGNEVTLCLEAATGKELWK